MSAIKEALTAIKDVLLLADRMEEFGKTLSEVSKEMRDIDRRLTRIEALIEFGKMQSQQRKKITS